MVQQEVKMLEENLHLTRYTLVLEKNQRGAELIFFNLSIKEKGYVFSSVMLCLTSNFWSVLDKLPEYAQIIMNKFFEASR